jgi:maleate cis-trans isomerase
MASLSKEVSKYLHIEELAKENRERGVSAIDALDSMNWRNGDNIPQYSPRELYLFALLVMGVEVDVYLFISGEDLPDALTVEEEDRILEICYF